MKLLKKLGIAIIGVIVSLKSLILKVYAKSINDPMLVSDYGVIDPTKQNVPNIAKIFGTIVIPIVLLIGIIVYFAKSKSKIWEKVLITIGVIAVYIVFAVIINNI